MACHASSRDYVTPGSTTRALDGGTARLSPRTRTSAATDATPTQSGTGRNSHAVTRPGNRYVAEPVRQAARAASAGAGRTRVCQGRLGCTPNGRRPQLAPLGLLPELRQDQPTLATLGHQALIRHTLVTTSYSDAKGKLLALKRFSAYLAHVPPGITPEVIDRPLIVAYEAHLRTLGVAPATIGLWLVALRSFFEPCAREGWAAVPERPLIYREDFPRHVRRLPRFIAEDVLQVSELVDCTSIRVRRN